MSKMAYLKVGNEHECVYVEYRKYSKQKHERPWECNLKLMWEWLTIYPTNYLKYLLIK